MQISKKRFVLLCISFIFVAYIVMSIGYGDYLDRSGERDILYSNVKEYAERLLGEDCEVAVKLDERGIINISESIEKDHGIAVYYPVWFLIYLEEYSMHSANVVWYTYTALIFCIGTISLYMLCRELGFSKSASSLAVCMLWLNPRMFAEGHYNNKDMILLSLCFMLCYFGFQFIQKRRWRDCFYLAITAAFAANIKIIGIWVFGVISLYYLLYIICTKRISFNNIMKGGVCIILWFAGYMILTPASWSGIIEFLIYNITYAANFSRWNDYILFQGNLISAGTTGIPRSYLPKMILITTPIITLVMIAWGYTKIFIDIFHKTGRDNILKKSYLITISFIGIVPLVYGVLSATPVYNGWRHFYFSYSSMIFAAMYGIDSILLWTSKYKAWILGGNIVCYLYIFVFIILNYPNEHSYYNVFAGRNVLDHYEMDYWELSIGQALKSIAEEQETNTEVSVSTFNMVIKWGLDGNYEVLREKDKNKIKIIEEWKEAEYIIVNPSYALMYAYENYRDIQQTYILYKSFESYGNTVCEIYCNNDSLH